jgi:prophage regulatory protein
VRVRKAKIVNTEPIPVKEPDFAFDFVLRPKQVAKAMGISTTTLYRWVAAGTFPKPQRLGVSMSFWRTSTVNAWLDLQRSG